MNSPHHRLLPGADRRAGRPASCELRFFYGAPGPDADGDDLDGALGVRITVNFLVLAMKRLGWILRVPGNGQLITLPGVADVGGANQVRFRKLLARRAFQPLELAL